MRGLRSKRAPAWSTREVWDLLGLWGAEGVQAQLQSRRRNADVYEKISQGMEEKGYQRDLYQCRAKAKELRLAYQKARMAAGRSDAAPPFCPFYKELHAILRHDPALKSHWGSSEVSRGATGDSKAELLDEDEEGTSGSQASGGSVVPGSQESFVTPERSSQLQPYSMADRDAGEGTSAAGSARGSPSAPSARLFQVRRRPMGTGKDLPQERMNAAGRPDAELRAAVSETVDVTCRPQVKETERDMQQELLGMLREQTDILRRLLDLQERYFKSRFPLRPPQNGTLTSPCFPTPPQTHSTCPRGPGAVSRPLSPRGGEQNPSRPHTDMGQARPVHF